MIQRKRVTLPLPSPAFILDVHLGKLARYLRLLGFDVAYANCWDDPYIVDLAQKENRIILTRDRGLLQRKAAVSGYLVQNLSPQAQLVEIVSYFHLRPYIQPFSLCPLCGTPIEQVPKESVAALVPEIVSQRYRRFLRCPSCGKIYWRGDHFRNISELVRLARKKVYS
ncbi:MAG: Mut7-C RNAse domain-containing protein [Spirochaetales bacterium]